MLFRVEELQKQSHAGFKKCLVTHVPSRLFAPFGSEFPAEDHCEVEIIAVPPKLRSLNEEWLESVGGSLNRLRTTFAYGFQDYIDQLRPDTYLDRLPKDDGFQDIAGFEPWTRESIEAHVKTKSIAGFMMPRRLVFNQADGTCSFYFEYRLDTQLHNQIYRIDVTRKSEVKYISSRKDGPGVLDKLPPRANAGPSLSLDSVLWWVKQGRFAGLAVPNDGELKQLSASGVQALVSLGAEIDAEQVESASMRYLGLPMPDSHEPDEEALQLFATACNEVKGSVAVCSHDQQAAGTMLGVGLLCDGHSVEEALAILEAASPAAVESMGQIEFLYGAAMMLGLDLE